MKIKVILPVTTDLFLEETQNEVEHYASENTQIGVSHLDYGPASIESEYDEALAIPDFLKKAEELKKRGTKVSLVIA